MKNPEEIVVFISGEGNGGGLYSQPPAEENDKTEEAESLLYEKQVKPAFSLPFSEESIENELRKENYIGKIISYTCCFSLLLLVGVILFTYEDYKSRGGTYIAGLVLICFATICIFPLCCIICCCTRPTLLNIPQKQKKKISVDERFELIRLNDVWDSKQKGDMDFVDMLVVKKAATKTMKLIEQRETEQEKDKFSSRDRLIETFVQSYYSKHGQEVTSEQVTKVLRPCVYVIRYTGDMMASNMDILRDQISMIIRLAGPNDEVIIVLESPGGAVHMYGLGASQILRLEKHGIRKVTVCVDAVAASGGYMMAVCGTRILAAPFALVGSIGVVSYMANFQRLLDDKKIDTFVFTAGKYKRTVDFVGEITQQGIDQQHRELEIIHERFKQLIKERRPDVNIDEVATGEAWLGEDALERKLVDEIKTSDEYILEKCEKFDVFEIIEKTADENFLEKLFKPDFVFDSRKLYESAQKSFVNIFAKSQQRMTIA